MVKEFANYSLRYKLHDSEIYKIQPHNSTLWSYVQVSVHSLLINKRHDLSYVPQCK